MFNFRFLKTFILFGIVIIFAAGCRTPEIVYPSGNITIDAGDSISFSAESYPDAAYMWTFDGGAKDVLGQNPTVQFNRAGVYDVFLTVLFEDLDSGITTVKVTVNGPSHGEALVEKTGQTTSSATGDDGDEQAGVSWPNPRFTDNSDGTVTDNLTGLMWLQDANCIQNNYPDFDSDHVSGDGLVTWYHALDFVSGINAGTYSNCGGDYTDWRLPNVNELLSLIHWGYYEPALPNTAGTGQWSQGYPFTNVQSSNYWSATTLAFSTPTAWSVYIHSGNSGYYGKLFEGYVWPVRAGQ